MNLSFCSGYLKVNLFMIRCFEPDSIALMNPLAVLLVLVVVDDEDDDVIDLCFSLLIYYT
jgi:hypothetical protein